MGLARTGSAWTLEDDDTIRRMAEANASAVLIAAKIKRTVSGVKRRAAVLQVRLRTTRDQRAIFRQADEQARR